MDPDWRCFSIVFPIEHGDIPASYVSLPEGKKRETKHNKNQGTKCQGFSISFTIKNQPNVGKYTLGLPPTQ